MSDVQQAKREGGALLFNSVFNQMTERFDGIEEREVETSGKLFTLRRRICMLERTLGLCVDMLYGDDPALPMACTACGHAFAVPRSIALDGIAICPRCYSDAVRDNVAREYSTQEVADRLGLEVSTVKKKAKRHGIGRLVGHGRRLTESDIEKVREHIGID